MKKEKPDDDSARLEDGAGQLGVLGGDQGCHIHGVVHGQLDGAGGSPAVGTGGDCDGDGYGIAVQCKDGDDEDI